MESEYARLSETFDLPPVLLDEYPDVNDVVNRDLRVTALAVFYDNRMLSMAFDTIEAGRPVRGLRNAFVAKAFEVIERRLNGLRESCEAELLAPFIIDEAVLLEDNRRRAAGCCG